MEHLVAVEETAAGLKSPEMMVTGLNQRLVMSVLNSELLVIPDKEHWKNVFTFRLIFVFQIQIRF